MKIEGNVNDGNLLAWSLSAEWSCNLFFYEIQVFWKHKAMLLHHNLQAIALHEMIKHVQRCCLMLEDKDLWMKNEGTDSNLQLPSV